MEASDTWSEQASRDRKSIPTWNSTEDALGFENFGKRLRSSILRKTTIVKDQDGSHMYNIGSTIVYLIDKVTQKGSGITRSTEDTLTRDTDSSLVSSPKVVIMDKLRTLSPEKRHKIPLKYQSLHQVLDKFAELEDSKESATTRHQMGDLLIEELDRAIEHDLAWILSSPLALTLMDRETPFVEPDNVQAFTSAERNYNGDLLLQLQQGVITGSAVTIFEDARHASFIQAWFDIRKEYGESNARQKYDIVGALFKLSRGSKDITTFKSEIMRVCSNVVQSKVTMEDLMKYAILQSLGMGSELSSLRILQSERMITKPDESVIDFVTSTFATLDLSDGLSGGTRMDAFRTTDGTSRDRCTICHLDNHTTEKCRSGCANHDEYLKQKAKRAKKIVKKEKAAAAKAALGDTSESVSKESAKAQKFIQGLSMPQLKELQEKLKGFATKVTETTETSKRTTRYDDTEFTIGVDTHCNSCLSTGHIFRLPGQTPVEGSSVATLSGEQPVGPPVTRTITIGTLTVDVTGRAVGLQPTGTLEEDNHIVMGLNVLEDMQFSAHIHDQNDRYIMSSSGQKVSLLMDSENILMVSAQVKVRRIEYTTPEMVSTPYPSVHDHRLMRISCKDVDDDRSTSTSQFDVDQELRSRDDASASTEHFDVDLALRRRSGTSTSIERFDVDQTLRRRSNTSTSIERFDVDQTLPRQQSTLRPQSGRVKSATVTEPRQETHVIDTSVNKELLMRPSNIYTEVEPLLHLTQLVGLDRSARLVEFQSMTQNLNEQEIAMNALLADSGATTNTTAAAEHQSGVEDQVETQNVISSAHISSDGQDSLKGASQAKDAKAVEEVLPARSITSNPQRDAGVEAVDEQVTTPRHDTSNVPTTLERQDAPNHVVQDGLGAVDGKSTSKDSIDVDPQVDVEETNRRRSIKSTSKDPVDDDLQTMPKGKLGVEETNQATFSEWLLQGSEYAVLQGRTNDGISMMADVSSRGDGLSFV